MVCLLSPLTHHPSVLAEDSQDLQLVDPELSNTPLPKLVLPPEPPAGLRLPEIVVKSDEWRGVQCGVQEPRHAVFQHADKWQSFWEKAMAPYSSRLAKVPPIDFNKDMVVGVFLGERGKLPLKLRSVRSGWRISRVLGKFWWCGTAKSVKWRGFLSHPLPSSRFI